LIVTHAYIKGWKLRLDSLLLLLHNACGHSDALKA